MTQMKKTFKSSGFSIFPTSIMVLFEIPQEFKGGCMNLFWYQCGILMSVHGCHIDITLVSAST